MKKVTGLFLIVLCLCVCAFALAENTAAEPAAQELPADLFDLWNTEGESPDWVANAVPASEGVLIAPPAVLDIPPDQLVVSDGVYAWEASAVVPDELERFALVFYNAGEVAPCVGYWSLLPMNESRPDHDCTVIFGDRMGSRIIRGVVEADQIVNRGQRCYLLTLTDPAPVGSPVLTSDGLLAGIVTAEWAEGGNRVVMLPADGVAASVLSITGMMASQEGIEPPQGLAVTMEKNEVTIDWSEMVLPEKAEGQSACMVVRDTANNYLTWYPMEGGERNAVMTLTPGRYYIIGPVVTYGMPDDDPSSFVSIYIPKAGKYTDYGFTPVCTAIAEAPEGGLKRDELPVPVTEVTEELLRSGRACFYSHSAYEVTETISGLTLLVSLTDPKGNNYCYESSWTFMPEYKEADIWYIPLKDSGLTGWLDAHGYPKGVYEVAYYIGGGLADSFTFELR